MSTEALRLADALRDGTYLLSVERTATESELRRLHGKIEALRAAPTAKREDLRCVIHDLVDQIKELRADAERYRAMWEESSLQVTRITRAMKEKT